MERYIMGCLFSWIIIILVFGPFLLFSDVSPFVAENPVLQGTVALNFLVNKTMIVDSLQGTVDQ